MNARYFEKQFELAYITKLPMFLHMRAAAADFCELVEKNKDRCVIAGSHNFEIVNIQIILFDVPLF